jgi:hypothetical protein
VMTTVFYSNNWRWTCLLNWKLFEINNNYNIVDNRIQLPKMIPSEDNLETIWLISSRIVSCCHLYCIFT